MVRAAPEILKMQLLINNKNACIEHSQGVRRRNYNLRISDRNARSLKFINYRSWIAHAHMYRHASRSWMITVDPEDRYLIIIPIHVYSSLERDYESSSPRLARFSLCLSL